MLPYGLKIAWLVLCTTGAATCWPVLWALAKSVDSWWAPMTYAASLTAMVLVFDLGLIWGLDPSTMSKAACLTQMGLVTFFALLLVGVCTSFNIAVTLSVFWPMKAHQSPRLGLQWRNVYLIFLIGFPCVSTVAEILVVSKYDAFEQSNYDNTMCDVTTPLWPRLLGYAGMPLLQSIPCVLLASYAALRISRMHAIHKRLLDQIAENVDYYDHFDASSVHISTRSRSSRQLNHDRSASPHFLSHLSSPPQPKLPPGLNPASLLLKSPSESFQSPISSMSQHIHGNGRHSLEFASAEISGTPTTATNLAPLHNVSTMEVGICASQEASTVMCCRDQGDLESLKFKPASGLWLEPESTQGDGSSAAEEAVNTPNLDHQNVRVSDFRGGPMRPARLHQLAPHKPLLWHIWRLLLFQGAFFVIVTMLTLSTLISIITDSRPIPFGTEHISGILSSWGPVLVFGHSPLVRRRLIFWRRSQPS